MYSVLYIPAFSNAKLVTEQNWKIAFPVSDMMKRGAEILCLVKQFVVRRRCGNLKFITVNRYTCQTLSINLDVTSACDNYMMLSFTTVFFHGLPSISAHIPCTELTKRMIEVYHTWTHVTFGHFPVYSGVVPVQEI